MAVASPSVCQLACTCAALQSGPLSGITGSGSQPAALRTCHRRSGFLNGDGDGDGDNDGGSNCTRSGSSSQLWSFSSGKRRGRRRRNGDGGSRAQVTCGIWDFFGNDLLRWDVGKWKNDLETHGSLAVYAPLEGGAEGRYACALKNEGWNFINLSARGLGDPEAYLSKFHCVTPAHVGKQAIVQWYFPPEVDYRLSLLPPGSKGVVLWILECQVLSKAELQYLVLLPAIQPNVRVVAEMGGYREFRWKPLKNVVGVPPLKALPDSTSASGTTSADSIEKTIPSAEMVKIPSETSS